MPARRPSLPSIVFTIILVGLVILATHPIAGNLSFLLLGAIAAAVLLCQKLLPGGLFFSLALANLIACYACFFFVILDTHFQAISKTLQWLGFLAPLVAYFLGAIINRQHIRDITSKRTIASPADFAHAVLWLLPLSFIGIAVMAYSSSTRSPDELAAAFVLAMALSSVLVSFASRDITLFMLDTGLLFEDFFRRSSALLAPIFAFFTFYSVAVIIYAAIYAIIDNITEQPHFRILGKLSTIDFSESLYFSIVTLATVGYGDIVPATNLIRMLAASEVLVGVMLLLFGFNEILRYTRRHPDDGKL